MSIMPPAIRTTSGPSPWSMVSRERSGAICSRVMAVRITQGSSAAVPSGRRRRSGGSKSKRSRSAARRCILHQATVGPRQLPIPQRRIDFAAGIAHQLWIPEILMQFLIIGVHNLAPLMFAKAMICASFDRSWPDSLSSCVRRAIAPLKSALRSKFSKRPLCAVCCSQSANLRALRSRSVNGLRLSVDSTLSSSASCPPTTSRPSPARTHLKKATPAGGGSSPNAWPTTLASAIPHFTLAPK